MVYGHGEAGVYCLASCTAYPDRGGARAFKLAAAAEAAGFRACPHCRPYRHPPTRSWALGPEIVCRAAHWLVDGELDAAVPLGISGSELQRLLLTHTGVTPRQLWRSCRTHFARVLLEDTDLSLSDVAAASGLRRVAALREACAEVFGAAPSQLRAARSAQSLPGAAQDAATGTATGTATGAAPGDGGRRVVRLRLRFDGPLDWTALLEFLRARAIPGVEQVDAERYRRTVALRAGPGVIEVRRGGADQLLLCAQLPDLSSLFTVVRRTRRIFALDEPLDEIRPDLALRPLIGKLVADRPGLRVPGAFDPFEIGVRAIIGQQVSVAGASTIIGRLARRLGTPLGPESCSGETADDGEPAHADGLTLTFPSAETVAAGDLDALGMPGARARAIAAFAQAVADRELPLERAASLEQLTGAITALRGLGPWTASYIALRVGERDAFPATDLGLRHAIERLCPGGDARPGELARRWSPWRASAAIHLWHSLG